MLSSNALKYKITVTPSYYAGVLIFLLYSLVISLSFFVIPISSISIIFFLILFFLAFIAANKAYQQSFEFKLSESGEVEREVAGKVYHGKISEDSFYNGFILFLKFAVDRNILSGKKDKQLMIIYKDAVTEEQYRLLARVINSRRD